jgi:DNA-directed RNA polymerase beta subunit/intein/homing endonuclease
MSNTKIVIRRKKKVNSDSVLKSNLDLVSDSISVPLKEQIKHIIENEKETNKEDVLQHLGDFYEEPFTIIESYFDKHLERLVRHQIESYNHFINYQIQKTIQMFNPVIVKSENDFIFEKGKYLLEVNIFFENFKMYSPIIYENSGAVKPMLPHEAKLRNFSYSSSMTVDLKVQYIIRNSESMENPKIVEKILPKINIGKMPIMLKSSICLLKKEINPVLTGECPMDCGGYFIIKGSEKTVLGQERAAENRIYCFDGKNTTKWDWTAEIKSVPDFKCISPKQTEMMIATKNNGFGNPIYVTIPKIKQPIELYVLFRAFGIISDKDITQYILLDIYNEKNKELLFYLQASVIESNKYLTQDEAIKHITTSAAYTPMNMDKETGIIKKREFTVEVITDIFPHCSTLVQKIYFLGYMAKRLIQTALGQIPVDDRDSYLNKRIELTGTLLNNLFRNYFNKIVKEMNKQVVREINNGSWRSTQDYENIINMTNIYKIIKSTTIENGISRALATGDFSIKQSTNSKVGVAQVLSRLTYVSSLSHLRRINTPIEKSGELIAPRKLHNTTWGYLCCLTEETDVLLSNRIDIKKIKNIKNDEWVNTVNKNSLLDEPSDIYNSFYKMPDKLFEITTISGRKIKATGDHPFLIKSDNLYVMKKLENLTIYDKVVIRHTVIHIEDTNSTFVNITNIDEKYRIELNHLLNTNLSLNNLKIIARLIGALDIDLKEKCDIDQYMNDIQNLGIKSVNYFINLMKEEQWLVNAELSIKREYLSAFQGCNETVYGETIIDSNIHNVTQIINMFKEFNINCFIEDNKLIIEKTTDNLIRYSDIINYTYCDEKRRKSSSIIEQLKIKKYNNSNNGEIIIVENGCICVQISSIKQILPSYVCDFTTRSENHSFVANSFVVSNCAETPEGQSIGIVKNLSYMTHVTIPTNSSSLYEYIEPMINKIETLETISIDSVKVFINGAWIGVTDNPVELYNNLKDKKYKGIINIYTSIIFDYKKLEIRVCNDGGRLTRPLLKVKDKKVLITLDHIEKIKNKELTWNDLLTNCYIDESVIEYIDPEEQNLAMIAMKSKDKNGNFNYTHCEIHSSTILGILASCIVFPENNQSPRNCYQTSMQKQAMGVYATNFTERMDKTAFVLTYPARPLVDTRLMNFLELNKVPSGNQIYVAIAAYTGYNCEDSVLINQGSIDRGMFLTTIYHTEVDQDKNIIRDEIIRCKPDKTKTKGIKFGNYEKLNLNGFIPENELVENNDIIIAKIVPIKENRNDPTKIIKFEDQSKSYKTFEETYIDRNLTGRNGDGYNFAKVRTRTLRKPLLGDKFACHGTNSEVLTDEGWKLIGDVTLKDNVCILDPETDNISYENPSEIHCYDYDSETQGKMYQVISSLVELTVTNNHRMWVKKRKTLENKKFNYANYEFIEAKECFGKRIKYKKSVSNYSPKEWYGDTFTIPEFTDGFKHVRPEIIVSLDDWLVFFGIWLAEGCANKGNVNIAAHKPRVKKALEPVIQNMGFTLCKNYCKKTDEIKHSWNINNVQLGNFMLQYSVGALNKYLPDWVWSLNKEQSQLLIESMMLGDGYCSKSNNNFYYTSSERLANDLSRLCLHAGWSAHKRKINSKLAGTTTVCKDGREITSTADQLCVTIIKKKLEPEMNHGHCSTQDGQSEKWIDYIGTVHCLTVRTGIFMVRVNGKPVWSGNSRSAQKGTCGCIISECDMPFTKEGLRPDLILNPHAIPSRMTIAQLKETLLGKVLVELGMFGDGTSFGNLSIHDIIKELSKLGYERYGNEIMYNGFTGKQFESSVFIGPTYYNRLKHMVNDKIHSRSIGPKVNLTRQPREGRASDGGFRVGEMERDSILAHGMSNFTKERLMDVSDKFSVHVCNKCGLIASYNDGTQNKMYAPTKTCEMTIYLCKTCENTTDFSRIEIPYACKLLTQELQTINVSTRFITDK